MKVSDIITKFSVQGRVQGSGPLESQSIAIHHATERKFLEPGNEANFIAVKRMTFFGDGLSGQIDSGNGVLTTINGGTRQVETATVVVPTTVSATSTAWPVTVTGIYDHDLHTTLPNVVVQVPTTLGVNATQMAILVRSALSANAVIAKWFTVGGSGAAVTLTSRQPYPNVPALSISWPAFNGISALSASTNTTAGVAGVVFESSGSLWVSPAFIFYMAFIVQQGSVNVSNLISTCGSFPTGLEVNPATDVGGPFNLDPTTSFNSLEAGTVLDVVIIGRDAS